MKVVLLFITRFFTVFLAVVLYVLTVSSADAQVYEKKTTYYDASQKIKREVFFVKKTKSKVIRDSSYVSFFQNGILKSKGHFSTNLPSGFWHYYFESGVLKATGTFIDGLNSGQWTYYYENGSVSTRGYFDKGVKQGEWKYYFESLPSNLKSEGAYLNDKREGVWKYYDETGGFKAQADFKQDKGMYTEFYSSGSKKSEGLLVDGKSSGAWKYFHDNGQVMGEGEERDGLKEGQWVFYDKAGALVSKGVYQGGKQFGTWNYFHPNGEVASSGEYINDSKEGDWTTFNAAGKKIGEGNFKSGSSIYKEFYESGKLKIQGPIEKDKNEGQWNYYYESGEKEGACFYKEGKGKYIGYYKDGTRKMEGLLENGNKTGIWRLYKPNGELAGLYKTYYDKDAPVFETLVSDSSVVLSNDSLTPAIKPSMKIRKKKSRYFTPRVNEFSAFILGANPVALLQNSIPFSVELYYQERIGYELGLIYNNDPMFKSHALANLNELYSRGYEVYFRQKFYQKDKDYGMLYFAHELRYSSNRYTSTIIDTTYFSTQEVTLELRETTIDYSILFGDRIIKDSRKKGFTFDVFVGIGIGYRSLSKDWPEDNKQYSSAFSSVNSSTVRVPFRLGFTFGYVFPRAK